MALRIGAILLASANLLNAGLINIDHGHVVQGVALHQHAQTLPAKRIIVKDYTIGKDCDSHEQDITMLLPTVMVMILLTVMVPLLFMTITLIITQLVIILITRILYIHTMLIHHVILIEDHQSTAIKVFIVITATVLIATNTSMESALTDTLM